MKPAAAFIVAVVALYLLWTGKAVRVWKDITT